MNYWFFIEQILIFAALWKITLNNNSVINQGRIYINEQLNQENEIIKIYKFILYEDDDGGDGLSNKFRHYRMQLKNGKFYANEMNLFSILTAQNCTEKRNNKKMFFFEITFKQKIKISFKQNLIKQPLCLWWEKKVFSH